MEIEFTQKAIEDRDFWKKSGQLKIQKKISSLLLNITETPFMGIGKPEQLTGDFSGYWSRRIDSGNRLVYEVKENTIYVYSMRGHYLDK